MHLLNIKTLKLECYLGDVPPYAILSHTWGPGEVTYQDVQLGLDLDQKPGWIKIVGFCKAVTKFFPNPPDYAWVDTCCIDKTSSAELSESINAMFRWYQQSQCCFALLEDVFLGSSETVGDDFEKARWFTRGWTLQELIAPLSVDFFDRDWQFIGSRVDLSERISARTNIGCETLLTGDLSMASVAQKMSWASGRQTTRPEDIAYCLLGMFDISMTMLYGEGERAFIRLQEEILKEYDDQTIFAWDSSSIPTSVSTIGVFATHPSFFSNSSNMEPHPSTGEPAFVTNRGIHMGLFMMEMNGHPLGVLSCYANGSAASAVAIPLVRGPPGTQRYSRTRSPPLQVPVRSFNLKQTSVFLDKRNGDSRGQGLISMCLVHYWPSVEPVGFHPAGSWRNDPLLRAVTLRLRRNFADNDEVKVAVVFKVPMSGAHFCLSLLLRPKDRTSRVRLSPAAPDSASLDTTEFNISSDNSERFRTQVRVMDHFARAESRVQLIGGAWTCDVKLELSRGELQGY